MHLHYRCIRFGDFSGTLKHGKRKPRKYLRSQAACRPPSAHNIKHITYVQSTRSLFTFYLRSVNACPICDVSLYHLHQCERREEGAKKRGLLPHASLKRSHELTNHVRKLTTHATTTTAIVTPLDELLSLDLASPSMALTDATAPSEVCGPVVGEDFIGATVGGRTG